MLNHLLEPLLHAWSFLLQYAAICLNMPHDRRAVSYCVVGFGVNPVYTCATGYKTAALCTCLTLAHHSGGIKSVGSVGLVHAIWRRLHVVIYLSLRHNTDYLLTRDLFAIAKFVIACLLCFSHYTCKLLEALAMASCTQ